MAVSKSRISSTHDSATRGLVGDGSRGPIDFDTIQRAPGKTESVAPAPVTRDLQHEVEVTTPNSGALRLEFGITKAERALRNKEIIEVRNVKESKKLTEEEKNRWLDDKARTTVIPETQMMLFRDATIHRVAILATNPELAESLHPLVFESLLSGLKAGIIKPETKIVLAKAPIEAPVAARIKLHIARMVDNDETLRVIQVVERDKITRLTAIDTEMARPMEMQSEAAQRTILQKERTAEFKALVARFAELPSIRDLIMDPETEEWLQVEFISTNRVLTKRDTERLKLLNKPEINKALALREKLKGMPPLSSSVLGSVLRKR